LPCGKPFFSPPVKHLNRADKSEFGGANVKRQLQGISVILFSIMLIYGFNSIDVKYVFGLDLRWAHIFMIIGIVGVVMVFWKDKKD
jgi:hypothetical protein